MTINLNKEQANKQSVLKYIKDIDIYRFYTKKEVVLGGNISSPFRVDSNPSFGYFIADNEILYKDFVLGGGDCIKFVETLFNINYVEALGKICVDFNLSQHLYHKQMPKTEEEYDPSKYEDRSKVVSSSSSFRLRKKERDWKMHDIYFWRLFGISVDILEKYNVKPLDYIFLNNQIVKAEKFSYCFKEYKDGLETYKIYQPYSKDYKWLSNHNYSVWQGWNQLPKNGENLIITKSLKDVMSIVSTTEYSAVSLQGESVYPKDHIIEELQNRFKAIWLLYDNDYDKTVNWGQKFANNLVDKYRFFNLVIDSEYECKDYSDLIKKIGVEKSVEHLEKLIITYIPF